MGTQVITLRHNGAEDVHVSTLLTYNVYEEWLNILILFP